MHVHPSLPDLKHVYISVYLCVWSILGGPCILIILWHPSFAFDSVSFSSFSYRAHPVMMAAALHYVLQRAGLLLWGCCNLLNEWLPCCYVDRM